jgi:hypothetical protein
MVELRAPETGKNLNIELGIKMRRYATPISK